ncbi:MAG: DUF5678 domain-containing protein [Patescibacteria group bacterium]
MTIDWTPIMHNYRGKWVAIADDEVTVLCSADTAMDVIRLAHEKGIEHPMLFKVPVKDVTFVGSL